MNLPMAEGQSSGTTATLGQVNEPNASGPDCTGLYSASALKKSRPLALGFALHRTFSPRFQILTRFTLFLCSFSLLTRVQHCSVILGRGTILYLESFDGLTPLS